MGGQTTAPTLEHGTSRPADRAGDRAEAKAGAGLGAGLGTGLGAELDPRRVVLRVMGSSGVTPAHTPRVELAGQGLTAETVLPSETFRRTVVGWLTLVTVVLSGVFVPLSFTSLLGQPSTPAGQFWLVLHLLLNVVALARRAHRDAAVFAFFGAVAVVNAVIPALPLVGGGPLTTLLLIVMFWIAVITRPAFVALAAVYVLIMLQVSGAEWVVTVAQMTKPTHVCGPIILVLLALAIAFAAAIENVLRRVDTSTLLQLEDARAARRRIAAELEAKLVELDASREQLMHAQKLQTVGTMASGLAHELNNILTPIRGLSELIVAGAATEQARRYGQRILDAAVSAAQITGSLLTYTRQGTFTPVRSDLRELFERQLLPVLGQAIPRNIRVQTRLASDVSADVDVVLFQQAITNLVLNAIDAMPSGGTLTIGIRHHVERAPHEAASAGTTTTKGRTLPGERDVRYARIDVADTGSGIEPEQLGRIFDPFFTTKRVGSGHGLGLPAVQGIVERHGGRVEVVSRFGAGSSFTLFVPLSEAADDVAPPAWPALQSQHGAAVVLVVSEDDDLRDELEDLVCTMHCSAITSDDPKAARSLLTELGDRLDLLLLDLGSRSVDLAQALRPIRHLEPLLPVVLLTEAPPLPDGEAPPDGSSTRGLAGPVRVLRKPIDQRIAQSFITELLHAETKRSRVPSTPT